MLSVCPTSHSMPSAVSKNSATRFGAFTANATDSVTFGKKTDGPIQRLANSNVALGLTGAVSVLLFCFAIGKAVIQNQNQKNNAPVDQPYIKSEKKVFEGA